MPVILPVDDKYPKFGNNTFIAPNATIVGDVIMQRIISMPSPCVCCWLFLFCGRANASTRQAIASIRKIKGRWRIRFLVDVTLKACELETLIVACLLLYLLIYHQISTGIHASWKNNSGCANSISFNQSYNIGLFNRASGLR